MVVQYTCLHCGGISFQTPEDACSSKGRTRGRNYQLGISEITLSSGSIWFGDFVGCGKDSEGTEWHCMETCSCGRSTPDEGSEEQTDESSMGYGPRTSGCLPLGSDWDTTNQ